MKYNYRRNVYEDVKSYIENTYSYDEFLNMMDITSEDFDIDLAEHLMNEMWIEDSVTGNASGSYTMSRWMAEDFLCHNLDLLEDALTSFGWDNLDKLRDPEACDVIIRCHLLYECIEKLLCDINNGEVKGWA